MRTDFHSEKEKHRFFNRMSDEQRIEAFSGMLAESRHVVFLGGAGVSTESGIPDFRSRNGLYRKSDKRFSKYRPEYLLCFDCLKREPEIFFDYYRRNLDARRVEPNSVHIILADMERTKRLDGILCL